MIELYTIGFTHKTAERFFTLLSEHKIELLVDIRRRPEGQLAGFAKKADLPFFMERLVGGRYLHLPLLAPDDHILSAYRSSHDQDAFETAFNAQMDQSNIPDALDRSMFENNRCCLLCSEHLPEHCHRRFVADRLVRCWNDVSVEHLI